MRGGASIGIGGVLLLLALSWATGTDFLSLLGGDVPVDPTAAGRPADAASPREERLVDFVDAIRNERAPLVDGAQGRRALALATAMP